MCLSPWLYLPPCMEVYLKQQRFIYNSHYINIIDPQGRSFHHNHSEFTEHPLSCLKKALEHSPSPSGHLRKVIFPPDFSLITDTFWAPTTVKTDVWFIQPLSLLTLRLPGPAVAQSGIWWKKTHPGKSESEMGTPPTYSETEPWAKWCRFPHAPRSMACSVKYLLSTFYI